MTPNRTRGRRAPPGQRWPAQYRLGLWVRAAFGEAATPASRMVGLIILVLIYVSIAAIVLESIPEVVAAYGPLLDAIELVVLVAFTVEYAANVYAASDRRRYVLGPWGIIDLLAILPSYLALANLQVLRITRTVRLLRMLRILRVLKLAKGLGGGYAQGRQRGASTLAQDLHLYFVSLVCVVTISSTLLYYAEGDLEGTAFPHIPSAMWWAVVTVATIGYDSLVPVTPAGRAVAVATMLASLALLALLINVVGRALSRAEPKKSA